MVVRKVHGEVRPTDDFGRQGQPSGTRQRIAGLLNRSIAAKLTEVATPPGSGLAFMFAGPQQDAANRLPVSQATVDQLVALGTAMAEPGGGAAPGNSAVPAVYTYFGQFLDHDISDIKALPGTQPGSLRVLAAAGPLSDPLTQNENHRLAPLDLDSVYTKAPEDQGNTGKLRLGKVSRNPVGPQFRVPGKDDDNDLPRNPPSATDHKFDRAAQIGDERNDENLIVAQLHVAFLRAHNRLVEELGSKAAARAELTRRYHEIIFTDFLPHVVDLGVLNDVLANGRKFWRPASTGEVPLEFAGAAFRFGHSMVRGTYDFNSNFGVGGALIGNRIQFSLLFTFTALTGQLGGGGLPEQDTLGDHWIADWSRLAVTEMARPIDTFITPAMAGLTDEQGTQLTGGMQILAERNLLRGYLLGLPTGQAIARAIGAPVLEGQALINALPGDGLKAAAGPFSDRSPLWFYVLAEAGANQGRLGKVGSTIVIETLHALGEAAKAVFPAGPIAGPSGKLLELLRFSGNL